MSGDVERNPGPNNAIYGILLNTRSVKSVDRNRNKLIELQSLVAVRNVKLVFLTETWLCADILDTEILPSDQFHVYRKDRNSHGGGALIGIHHSIQSRTRQDLVPLASGNMDIVAVEMLVPKEPKALLLCVYIPPGNAPTNPAVCLGSALQAALESGYNSVHLLGDFNLPNLDLVTGLPFNNNFYSPEFHDCFLRYNLSHLVDFPTHRLGNRLDLILSSVPESFSDIFSEENTFPSDHFLINFSLSSPEILHKPPRSVFNYKKANWLDLKRALLDADLDSIIEQHSGNVSDACDLWTKKILSLVETFIPKIRIRKPGSPPWVDAEVLHLSRKKENTRRKALRNNNPHTWTSYRRLRNRLRYLINSKYNKYINDTYNDICSNPKRFWGLVQSKRKSRSSPSCVTVDGATESSPSRKAQLFNKYFHSNFTQDSDCQNLPDIDYFQNENISDVQLDIPEIRLLLSTLDSGKAIGPDSLSGHILKECAAELAPSLTKLFNLSLSLGTVPLLWKTANVTPVFKKGDPSLCSNYRPISLLCITSKIFERAILQHTYDKFSHLITNVQHGFLPSRSTSTQLYTVLHDIYRLCDQGVQADMIYLDFSKAFDSVSHSFLLHKLKSYGFSGNLHKWFSSYLNSRFQRVVLEGINSDWLPVTSGVPQGSIFGPIMFILYSNDLGSSLSPGTSIALYADDAKIFRHIYSLEDCRILQTDLQQLEKWSKNWKLNFNTDKCKVMCFGRNLKFSFKYRLCASDLRNTTEFNDLGLLVSNSLSWKPHIQNIIAKAHRTLGLIKRTLGFHAPLKSKLLLYKSLVRSTLTYASILWYPDRRDLALLEGVQRNATKYILNDYTSHYTDRLRRLDLIPLSFYRELTDICFFYKCLHGFFNLDILNFVPLNEDPNYHTRASTDRLVLKQLPFRTEFTAKFFSHRIVKLWNSLPLEIRSIVCINKNIKPFKTTLYKLYMHKLSTNFNVDNLCTWVGCCRCPACRPT